MNTDTITSLSFILGDYRGPLYGKNEYLFCCPFCPEKAGKIDVKYKLWVNPILRKYHCWRCNEGGSLDKLFLTLGRKVQRDDIRLFPLTHPLYEDLKVELPDDFHSISISSKVGDIARRYLFNRGLSYNTQLKYGIGYCTEKMLGYIVFPIYMNGELVGWTSRAFVEGLEPKHRHNMGRVRPILFGFDQARGSRRILIAEGPISTAMAFQHTGIECVGTLGKSVESKSTVNGSIDPKVSTLVNLRASEYIFLVESDAIWDSIRAAQALYKLGKDSYVSFLPKESDPASLNTETVLSYLGADHLVKVNGVTEVLKAITGGESYESSC